MTEEREPFTKTFTQPDLTTEYAEVVGEPVVDNLELPTDGKADATENTETINGIVYTKEEPRVRIQGMVRIPDDIKTRIEYIALMERRKLTAVIEKAISDYLEDGSCEPRPYLPFTNTECKTRLNFYLSRDMESMIEGRARIECRTSQNIVRRAVMNYIEASEYDPEKTSPEGEVTA